MKIGITGAKGFIGSHLVRSFRAIKGTKVFLFDLPEGSVLDSGAVAQFVKGKDVIVHAAAVNRGTDTEVIAGTVVATYNLISAVAKLKQKPKIIFLSSVQADTSSLYGISKKLAESMLEDFSKSSNAQVSVFRLANVFGEGCRPFYNSVIATFCHQLARGEDVVVNPSEKKFSFVYVGDVVSIITKEAFAKRAARFYFKTIASRDELTIAELASLLKKIVASGGKRLKSVFEKKLYTTYQSHVAIK